MDFDSGLGWSCWQIRSWRVRANPFVLEVLTHVAKCENPQRCAGRNNSLQSAAPGAYIVIRIALQTCGMLSRRFYSLEIGYKNNVAMIQERGLLLAKICVARGVQESPAPDFTGSRFGAPCLYLTIPYTRPLWHGGGFAMLPWRKRTQIGERCIPGT